MKLRNVEARVDIAVHPRKIIRAFTDATSLKSWWGCRKKPARTHARRDIYAGLGISEQRIKYISSGIIKEYDSGGALHIEKYIYLNPERSFLGPQELKIEAIVSGNGSTVSVATRAVTGKLKC